MADVICRKVQRTGKIEEKDKRVLEDLRNQRKIGEFFPFVFTEISDLQRMILNSEKSCLESFSLW